MRIGFSRRVSTAAIGIAVGTSSAGLVAQGMGPYANVKTFTGTVTVEGNMKTVLDTETHTASFRATGPATLTDNMYPDGAHFVWPMASPADLARGPESMMAWNANVTYNSTEVEPRQSALVLGRNVACAFSGPAKGSVAFMTPMGSGRWMVTVTSPPLPRVTCTGTRDGEKVNETAAVTVGEGGGQLVIEGMLPAALSGTKMFTQGPWKFTVTYALAPGR